MGVRTPDKPKKPTQGWRVDADGVECFEADGSTGISRSAEILDQDGKVDGTKAASTPNDGVSEEEDVDRESWIGKLFLGATEVTSSHNQASGEGDELRKAKLIQQRELRARAAAARANERKRSAAGAGPGARKGHARPNYDATGSSAPPLMNGRKKEAKRSSSSSWSFGNMLKSMNPFSKSTSPCSK
jgi:hypothetical protein